jgi:hypothetical protein
LGFIKTSKDEGILVFPGEYSQNLKKSGIWTKHLKSKTKLHQTVMQQCLQSLMAKKLIKRVPSVQVGVDFSCQNALQILPILAHDTQDIYA